MIRLKVLYHKPARGGLMKSGLHIHLLWLTLALVTITSGCGESSRPPITVSVTTTATTAAAGDQISISAHVNNDSSNRGVTWTMSPTPGTGAGVLTNATGTTATYRAPGNPPANDVPVTITAASVADPTKSSQVSITFAAVSVSVTATPDSVEATGTAQVSATVNNDSSNQGVTWSISPSTGAGTLSKASSTSVTYTWTCRESRWRATPWAG